MNIYFLPVMKDSSFVEHSKKRRLLIDSDIFLDVTEDDLFDNRIKVDLVTYMPSRATQQCLSSS